MKDIFSIDNYIAVIQRQIALNAQLRGYQSILAEKAMVHTSYFSRVLSKQVHLTPDQGAKLAAFWNLNGDQTEYFIGLVHLARAGAKELKLSINRQLKTLIKNNEDLTKRFENTAKITSDTFGIYYSTWYIVPVHMLLTIKGFTTIPSIAQKLALTPDTVAMALNTLANLSLVEKVDAENYRVLEGNIHLSNRAYWSGIYHASWRHKIGDILLQRKDEEEIHFTGLNTISRKDFLKIRKNLSAALEEARQVSLDSKEEDLYCLALDYFKL